MSNERRVESDLWYGPNMGEKTTFPKLSLRSRLLHYHDSPIRIDLFVETLLLALTFSIGIQDAASFPDFHCFASNQTGNTVLLAVGLAGFGHDLFYLPLIATSLSLFLIGVLVTGQLANHIGPRQRGWLFWTNFVQSLAVFGAVKIQLARRMDIRSLWALGSLGLLALSSGAQVASVRPLRLPAITTAMATAAWVDLLIDPAVLTKHNRPRDRRILFLVTLVAGSFAGAFMKSKIGSPLTIAVSGMGKVLVTVGILFCREERTSLSSNVEVV